MKTIQTKYHGPTNTKGSRFSACDEDGNKVFVSYDYALTSEKNHHAAALALCDKMNWSGQLVGGGFKNRYYWVFID